MNICWIISRIVKICRSWSVEHVWSWVFLFAIEALYINTSIFMYMVLGSLEVMLSGFGSESRVLIQMPPKSNREHAVYVFVKSVFLKVPWSVCRSLFSICCLWIKYSSETDQNCEGGDEWCCHLSTEADVGLLPLCVGFISQETSLFALNLIAMCYRTWPT